MKEKLKLATIITFAALMKCSNFIFRYLTHVRKHYAYDMCAKLNKAEPSQPVSQSDTLGTLAAVSLAK